MENSAGKMLIRSANSLTACREFDKRYSYMLSCNFLRCRCLVPLVLLSLSSVPARAADATWISTSSTAWSSGANWSGGFPGALKAAKANAFGTGSLLLNGGTLDTGGFNQSLGTLAVAGLATIDLADGVSTLTFAANAATNWLGSVEILNWTEGVDSVRFGTTASGLTLDQVARITFPENEGRTSASIDPNGFIVPVPVPEPSGVA